MIKNVQFNQNDEEGGSNTATIEKTKTKLPKKYKVLLHNDDYTTMEFVIFILQTVFHKNLDEAERIMLEVHVKGAGVCGTYNHEIAESKCKKVLDLAKAHSHPLISSIEPE
jgi:ATP-dependent Clp protease adaptor protein ClpS